MAVNDNEDSFNIDVTGSKTGKNYVGQFKAIKFLSFNNELQIDALRRQLLGNAVGTPTERAANEAELLANVGIRVTDGPSWFNDTNGLLNCFDDEPLSSVYSQCVAVTNKAMDAVKKKAEDAKKSLAAPQEETV